MHSIEIRVTKFEAFVGLRYCAPFILFNMKTFLWIRTVIKKEKKKNGTVKINSGALFQCQCKK